MFSPQNFGNDIQVDGAILSYTELWIAGSGKTLNETNTNTNTEVYDFVYKTVSTIYLNIVTKVLWTKHYLTLLFLVQVDCLDLLQQRS